MPEQKKKKTSKTEETAKSGTEGKTGSEKEKSPSAKNPADTTFHQVFPYLLMAVALFLLVGFLSRNLTGLVGRGLRALFYGLFGGGALSIPPLLLLLALTWRKEIRNGTLKFRLIYEAVFFIFLSAMIHLWTKGSGVFNLKVFWESGQHLHGGGVIGGFFGWALYKLTGIVGAHIIGITAITVFGLFMFGLTPYSIYIFAAYRYRKRKEKKAEEAASESKREERKRYFRSRSASEEEHFDTVRRDPVDRRRFDPDVEVGEGQTEESEEKPTEKEASAEKGTEAEKDRKEEERSSSETVGGSVEKVKPLSTGKLTRRPESVLPVGGERENADLKAIFTDPSSGVDVIERFAEAQKAKALEQSRLLDASEGRSAELEISRSAAVGDGGAESLKKEYAFPPVTLLTRNVSPKNVDISEELHTNAVRLVETLRSFKVRTRIVNVSRGPAITRYELAPEEGVRVRSIANLVDDIALNLATPGVRIEAPIPGKAAVGIEVPNKTVSTVYLRELVDTETFREAPSHLNVSLGVDVAGEPVFLDIAKMPHLLIAGATGMGKSVCINSMITSLLYKSTPEEVKLILIDPKKVELNIYNGLPHLLVPVVSDPKKAAGALHWAVTEMERRFELIEEVGVRDLRGYNSVMEGDPDREVLSQIVIIIDELADLMMTAPDDVEESICRLAQKARAAGMHLIIGTQRPSVDVITGLIKGNIPSRIAFTVASQTDSRVILDMVGAEKLIGRGDMLYAPVGALKPIRVQGAFVSEKEVEDVVSFIREHNDGVAEYSEDIMDSIDRAAAACGNGKKGALSDDDEDEGGDSMLRKAIELALESGKISTSLIQRRLSLGYGRAAKLIDEMEKRGFVSGPDGQKPRNVLITKQQYMEMVVNRSEDLE